MLTKVFESLMQRLSKREASVGVVGLGYAGLPLARAVSDAGFRVLGFDTDVAKVAMLQNGGSYISHLPSQTIRQMLAQGFSATSDIVRLTEPDVLLLCVPTPLTETREPDLSFVVKSSEAIAKGLRPGQLIVL